jgi:hypothetical protein
MVEEMKIWRKIEGGLFVLEEDDIIAAIIA